MDTQLHLEKCTEMIAACTCLQLRKASRIITQLFDEALRPLGIRSTQLPVLASLNLTGSTTITDLAKELVMDRTSVTRLLKPLENEDLVRIAPGGDRRTREVALTSNGRNVVAQALPFWAQVQARVTKELGPQLSDGLQRILSAVQRAAQS